MLFYLLSAEELTDVLHRLGYDFDPATIPATVAHYLARTTHGSTLSRVVHAWVLSRGDRPASWRLLREALDADLADTQGGTTREGIHLGAMAATADILQRCYTGLETRGDTLRLHPRLPDALTRLDFDLRYRGHWLRFDLDPRPARHRGPARRRRTGHDRRRRPAAHPAQRCPSPGAAGRTSGPAAPPRPGAASFERTGAMTSTVAATLRQVLVATDPSEQAAAVRRAAQLAAQHNADMAALYVSPAGLDPELAKFADACLRSHLDRCAKASVAEAVVRHCTVLDEIDAEAHDCGADLLVVGAHGKHWLTGCLLGSTSENLVRVSQIPVLVVKHPPRGAYRAVVLAVDTSPVAAHAARTASFLTPHAIHTAMHVSVVIGETLLRMHGTSEEQLAQLRRVSTEQVRGDIDDRAAELGARAVIESGRPQERLPELFRRHNADLIAVGTGSRSTLGYALIGSVAQHVLRDVPADVLVVPAPRTG